MSDKLTDMRNLRFLLYEVFNAEELTKYPFFEDHSKETFDMALDTAYQMARELFWSTYQEFDREGAQFDGEKVTVPAAMKEIWRQCSEGGWFAPGAPYDYGGQQFPALVHSATTLLFNCGNTAAYMYIVGSHGAGFLVEKVGTQELKDTYLEKLYTGQWAGTMALTEPDAGSSVGDITTTAVKVPDGDYYMIKGVKRFISHGDHDQSPNIVHPVLARIEGAPAGVKGISLFLVPKYRLDADGNPGDYNDVATAGIEHKLGLKGNATATLNFGDNDDCRGWLVGEENKGLKHMFLLLNSARLYTGIQATATASTAYQCAVEYANERLQGREVTCKDPETPPVPIVNHADVRLMLLKQKAFIEGMIGLILRAAKCSDLCEVLEGEEREYQEMLLGVLTPCIKAHGSDGSFESIRLAMQVYGGAGYCEEYPISQLMRDCKVFSIYEGTNGIQAMDLLGRKVPMKQGAALRALTAEIEKTMAEAEGLESLQDMIAQFKELGSEIVSTTMHLAGVGMSGEVALFMSKASPYLEMFSQYLLSWQLIGQAVVAQKALDAGSTEEFYNSKIATARFYVNHVSPQALATAKLLRSEERDALDFKPEWF